jgi:hypothetical protein
LATHVAAWLLIVRLLRPHMGTSEALALAVVWFAPGQYESFLWGWALHGGLTLGLGLAAIAVADRARTWRAMPMLALACVGASLSTATGLATWPIAVGVLIARHRFALAGGLLACALACGAAYFTGYVKPDGYHQLQFLLLAPRHAVSALKILLGIAGLPFGLPSAGAVAAGALLVVLGSMSIAARARTTVAGAAVGVLGATWWLAAALGRYDGTDGILAIARYGWTALLLWAVLVSARTPRVLRSTVVASFFVLGVASWWHAPRVIDAWRSNMQTQRDELLHGVGVPRPGLFWAPELIPALDATLRDWQFSYHRRSRE